MNRRRHARQDIALSALVHPAAGRSWLCGIRDFCEQGMLLVGAGAARSLAATGADPRPGDGIAVHFAVPGHTGQRHFRTQAKIARMLDDGNGIGVIFERGMPEAAFAALMEFGAGAADVAPAVAEPIGSAGTAGEVLTRHGCGIGESAAAEIRAKVRRVLERNITHLSEQYFEIALPSLMILARDAVSNTVQMTYLEAREQLEKRKEEIERTLSREVLRQLDQVIELDEVLERRRRRETGGSGKLQLVDPEQFEDWLAVAEVIARAEARFANQLLDMRAQFGLLARPWTHKDAVPVGPAVIAWAFDDCCRLLDVKRGVRKEMMRCFEQAWLPTLSNLYAALAEVLESAEALPAAAELRASLARSVLRPAPAPADTVAQAAADGLEFGTARVPSVSAAATTARPGRAGGAALNFRADTAGDAYATARSLLALSRKAGVWSDGAPTARPVAESREAFRSSDILAALSEVAREAMDAPPADLHVQTRLLEKLKVRHGGRKVLREEDSDSLDVVYGLVQSIESDHYLTQGIREWARRLEVTLAKLAAGDPAFLRRATDRPHSAMFMLDQLARLGNAEDVREGIDREVGRRVDQLLARVISEFDGNPGVFAEVSAELSPLIDRQLQTYRDNVERTVQASEGQQKLVRARRAVLREMEDRLAGRDVPALALQLLDPGWRNLLVHTHLRRGAGSVEWRDYLALFDQIHDRLAGRAEPDASSRLDPEALLKRIAEALNDISFDPSKRTPLIMALSDALIGDAGGTRAAVRWQPVPAGGVAAALGLDGLFQELDPQIDGDDGSVQRHWLNAVERARRVQAGEWLATSDRQGRPQILNVAFVGDDSSSFVLVNRKGLKIREMTLPEFARGLHGGKMTLLEDFDTPLMERASARMLDKLHQQLAHQAAHDELTQLPNRKAFERAVTEAVASARGGLHHALLYVDLDQFKIVNTTSGHTAGDELLKLVGRAIAAAVGDDRALVARLGGDEFGILLPGTDSAGARVVADKVLGAVRGIRFVWEDRTHGLSASVGLVFIDRSTASVDEAMQFADEACYAAKDAGRNRVQEYELDDAGIRARHGVMQWLTQLDKAIDEERLLLNCQRIAPATGENPADSHFEILLSMVDEEGEVTAPAKLILAAETYQRMTVIDRWVIARVLAWMGEHREELDRFNGFAINISGHSINDASFADFVLEQFAFTQAPTGKVCFEITETAAIANLDNARDFMNRMKILGCRFSLDDFGTGLSSYSYLRNLPVDYLKIDGVFVRDIAEHPSDYAVVRSINEIGHFMGKRTIAECVENSVVLERLREIGVDYVQGYHIGKPCRLELLRP